MPELNREQIIAELQEIIDHFAGSLNRYWTLSNALTLIKQLTEENERLKERADRYLDNLKAVLDERAEQDVAREIFEEIEKKLRRLADESKFLRDKEINLGEKTQLNGEWIGVRLALSDIADLKKKYIGE